MMPNINDWLAIKLTAMMSNMWAAYVFCSLSLISLPAAISSHDAFIIVSWISQSFLQLTLLPIIMVGQKLMGKSAESRAEQDHNALMEAITDLHQIMLDESSMATVMDDIKDRLVTIQQILTKEDE